MVDYIVTRKLTGNHVMDLCDTVERPRIMPARFARPQFPWNTWPLHNPVTRNERNMRKANDLHNMHPSKIPLFYETLPGRWTGSRHQGLWICRTDPKTGKIKRPSQTTGELPEASRTWQGALVKTHGDFRWRLIQTGPASKQRWSKLTYPLSNNLL